MRHELVVPRYGSYNFILQTYILKVTLPGLKEASPSVKFSLLPGKTAITDLFIYLPSVGLIVLAQIIFCVNYHLMMISSFPNQMTQTVAKGLLLYFILLQMKYLVTLK